MYERMRAELRRTYLRIRSVLGYVDNVAWLRATLNRRVAVDEARAHIAVRMIELTLEQRRLRSETRHDRS